MTKNSNENDQLMTELKVTFLIVAGLVVFCIAMGWI